jgi:hypothetical protein
MTTISVHEFDDVMKDLDIVVSELGCVMLPTEPFDIFSEGREHLLDTEDLYASNDPDKWWVQGDVSAKSHVTLLYGLMKPAYEQKEAVDRVLDTWEWPEYLIPERIVMFPSQDDDEYAAIVVEFEDPRLVEAHQRLSYLPHINTFAEYRPHMTLCYVRLEAAQYWVDILDQVPFHVYVKGSPLDYGSEK